jgi:hypothetical protein|tara:strand:+ start:72 stop:416 length:345 start_codon:yes stop_codon:yes gene_type:complete
MEKILILSQLVVAISVIIVWVFRKENIIVEFEQYGISDIIRNIVGALKISLATILILGIWYNEFLILSSLGMAFLMICAQYFHIKVRNPFKKFIPSLCLLILCLFIAVKNLPII